MSSRRPNSREAEPRRGGGDRPSSRAAESQQRAGGPSLRGPANPLLAEAAKLAKQRMEVGKTAAPAAANEGPERPASRGGWRVAMEEQEGPKTQGGAGARAADSEPEPGELPAAEPAAAVGGDHGSEPARKRKHARIVWSTPPKGGQPAAAGSGEDMDQPKGRGEVHSGGGLTAADIAHAELLAFQARQQAEDDVGGDAAQQGYMKASPSVSSPEEEMHKIREGTSVRVEGDALEADMADSRKRSRWADMADSAPQDRQQRQRGQELDGDAAQQQSGEQLGPEVEDGGAEGALQRAEERAGGSGGGSEADADDEEEETPAFRRPCTMLAECRSVDHYEKLNRISEGTYGVVYRARDRETGAICALKKVKLDKEREGFPLTSVREINILLSLDHPNIVGVSEVVVGSSLDAVFMVMEYGDHDLRGVMEGRMAQPFSTAEAKTLMAQLLSGVAYLHERWVLHRDLKTSNILYTNRGGLKICDFGLARQYGSPLKPYTHCVVTLWYRAPELLLGQHVYSTAVDVWSCGCIMGELLCKEPLIQGKNEIDQLQKIFALVGTPTEESWPGVAKLSGWRKFNFRSHPKMAGLRQRFPPPGLVFDGRPALSETGFDLLSRLLDPCPERRISAQEALEHQWFREHPQPKDPALMPTFPSTTTAPRH